MSFFSKIADGIKRLFGIGHTSPRERYTQHGYLVGADMIGYDYVGASTSAALDRSSRGPQRLLSPPAPADAPLVLRNFRPMRMPPAITADLLDRLRGPAAPDFGSPDEPPAPAYDDSEIIREDLDGETLASLWNDSLTPPTRAYDVDDGRPSSRPEVPRGYVMVPDEMDEADVVLGVQYARAMRRRHRRRR